MSSSLAMQMYTAMREVLGEPALPTYGSPFEAALELILSQGNRSQAAKAVLSTVRQATGMPLITPENVAELPAALFEESLGPANKGKAATIRNLLAFLASYAHDATELAKSDLLFLHACPTSMLRENLLGIRGIGPDTAEALLLYAFNRPVFVTGRGCYRIVRRHGMVAEDVTHEELRELFIGQLPENRELFMEYAQLLREVARKYCKTAAPSCAACPLKPFLEYEPEDL